jgi:hypothetical protein
VSDPLGASVTAPNWETVARIVNVATQTPVVYRAGRLLLAESARPTDAVLADIRRGNGDHEPPPIVRVPDRLLGLPAFWFYLPGTPEPAALESLLDTAHRRGVSMTDRGEIKRLWNETEGHA